MSTHKPVKVDLLFGELKLSNDDRKWEVIHTKPKREKKLALYMKENGIHYFLPLNNSVRNYKYRKVTFTKPLFPGYIFANINHAEKREIIITGHIVNFLRVINQQELLEDLQRIYAGLTKGAVFKEHPYVEVGSRVKIKSGPFIGLVGLVTDTQDKVILQVRFLRKAVSISVDPSQIEILE